MQSGAFPHSWRPKITSGALLFALLLLQAGLVLPLTTPYRVFPSDDLNYYVGLIARKGGLLPLLADEQHPFYLLYFLAWARICEWWAAPLGTVFIVSGLMANSITLSCLTLLTHRYTKNMGWSVLIGLLFISSAWTNNYYYFFSYTPLPTALLLLAFTLLVPARPRPTLPSGREKWSTLLAGAVLGLAFWSAPAALIMTGILFPLPLLIDYRDLRARAVPLCRRLGVGFLTTFIPFFTLSFPAYYVHVRENIATQHYDDAFDKFRYVPKPPLFSFLRILGEYSWLQAFLALTIIVGLGAIAYARHRRRPTSTPGATPEPLPEWLFLGLILAGICALHALAIDLLPSTKLGRTHFQIFPFLLLLLVIPPAAWLAAIVPFWPRKIAQATYYGLLCLSVFLGAGKSLETRTCRFTAPEYLDNQEVHAIYLLKEDPHAELIKDWLNDTRIKVVSAETLSTIIAAEVKHESKGLLLIGPTGAGSGNSILQHSTLPDFTLPFPDSIAQQLIYLPYYSFYPPFLFEEEICEALYWSGKIPKHEALESGIKVLQW